MLNWIHFSAKVLTTKLEKDNVISRVSDSSEYDSDQGRIQDFSQGGARFFRSQTFTMN